MAFLFQRKPKRHNPSSPDSAAAHLSMTMATVGEGRATPLLVGATSSSHDVPTSMPVPSGAQRSGLTLRHRLRRMLFGQRALNVSGGTSSDVCDDERQRWASERRMLLEDSAAVRAEVVEMQQLLDGYQSGDLNMDQLL